MPDLLAPTQHITLTEISWEGYETILNLLGDRPVRVTYNRGLLELMILSYGHERYKKLLARLVETLTEELNLPMEAGGSTTFKRQNLERGLEPDECFYIQNQALVRGKRSIDLNEDPPPDLVIEVDITHSAIDRAEIYAALGVPELWRWDNGILQFWVLRQQQYQQVQTSATFAQLSATDLEPFIALADQTDQTTLIRRFRAWVQESLMTREKES
ncbi:Uma2 family endonuclease [Synechococcales cyanobacterium C]|uniref:Uma2 family endonuclease n=1 Tax=Petrachloros mirabilis ULC683 TaxID=2781853 RepID=A0A8K1ZWG3_9CYAN|nr:Uma2 family endonuclease [Petrachloros mirabilis]NCJ06510.1 Uma2 family endonuclease [Petrachloros mirabilis ULC683]